MESTAFRGRRKQSVREGGGKQRKKRESSCEAIVILILLTGSIKASYI